MNTALLILYCILILAASLAGGWIGSSMRLTHRRMEMAVSFVAGVMLGVGVLHMLPHAIMGRLEALPHSHDPIAHEAAHETLAPIFLWLLAGFLLMFFIERFFCFHHHEAPDHSDGHDAGECDHDHAHAAAESGRSHHKLTWTGAAIGLSVHSIIEGIALAASFELARHGHANRLAAFATFLVILLHKPFDSLTIGTLMNVSNRAPGLRHIVNAAFSLLVPVGIGLFYLGLRTGDAAGASTISAALAFSAGTFLCIAMSDLLPELQFHHHDRAKLSAALIAGLALAWLISLLEAALQTHLHG